MSPADALAVKEVDITYKTPDILRAERDLRKLQGIQRQASELGLDIFDRDAHLNIAVNQGNLAEAETAITAARNALQEFGLGTMTAIIEKFGLPAAFSVSVQKQEFARQIFGKSVDVKLKSGKNKEIVITKELINFLTIDLTIGTPPVTKSILDQFRSILLGSPKASEIKEFLRLTKLDYHETSLLIDDVSQAINMDTHYLTAQEEEAHLRRLPSGFQNAKEMGKTVVSGGPNQAQNLIREYLYRNKKNDVEIPESAEINQDYGKTIDSQKGKIFILKVKEIPRFVRQDPNWKRNLGRIIFIDASEAAQRTGVTYVLSFFDDVINNLSRAHTNIAGKPSSTQLKLREMIEKYTPATIEKAYAEISKLEREAEKRVNGLTYGGKTLNADEDEAGTFVADYYSLRQFRETLEVIREVKGYTVGEGRNARPNDLDAYRKKLISETEECWSKYMYRYLKKSGYKTIVGNGGGREGIHLVGKALRAELKKEAQDLLALYEENGPESIAADLDGSAITPEIASDASRRRNQSPHDERLHSEALALRAVGTGIGKTVRDLTDALLGKGADIAKQALDLGERRFPGSTVVQKLREAGASLAGALETRDLPTSLGRTAAHIKGILSSRREFHERDRSRVGDQIEGIIREKDPYVLLDFLEKKISSVERHFVPTDEDHPDTHAKEVSNRAKNRLKAEQLAEYKTLYRQLWDELNDVEKDSDFARNLFDEIRSTGSLKGRLVVEETMWSYGNVLEEQEFPEDYRLILKRNPDGTLNTAELRNKLMTWEAQLKGHPDLFKLLCKSVQVVINTPHNPSSRILPEKEIFALLDIAADYGITVIDDSSYYKIVRSGKDGKRPHYPTIAELYERNKELFGGRRVRIITIATPTKNLSAAGGRTHMVLCNDEGDENIEGYLREAQSDKSPNILAMDFVRRKAIHGKVCKDIYEELDKFISKKGLTVSAYLTFFRSNFPPEKLLASGISHEGYQSIINTYYNLVRLEGRGANATSAKRIVERLKQKLKELRPEKAAAMDVDNRFDVALKAVHNVSEELKAEIEYIEPEGTFYLNIKLENFGEDQEDIQKFLETLSRRTGVGGTSVKGTNDVRLALGGYLSGDEEGYKGQGEKVRIAVKSIYEYWRLLHKVHEGVRKYKSLADFDAALEGALRGVDNEITKDLKKLVDILQEREKLFTTFAPKEKGYVDISGREKDEISYMKGGRRKRRRHPLETDFVYKIEDESQAINVVLKMGEHVPNTMLELMDTQEFQALYEFFIRNFHKNIDHPSVRTMGPEDILAKYNVAKLKSVLDPTFARPSEAEVEVLKQILLMVKLRWYSSAIRTNLLLVHSEGDGAGSRRDVNGTSDHVGKLMNEIFEGVTGVDNDGEKHSHAFASGYRIHKGIKANKSLPKHVQTAITSSDFIGEMTSPREQTTADTGQNKRKQGRAFSFDKKEGVEGKKIKKKFESERFKEILKSGEYVATAVRAGPTKQLVVMHKSCLHLMRDLYRLFPRLEEVTNPNALQETSFDAVVYFGVPKKLVGEHQMTGYYVDKTKGPEGEQNLPVGWVARSDETDYVGFLKKMVLTLHNEKMIEKGAVPIHGALYKFVYEDGHTFNLVGSADSGAGKSEMVAKMREMLRQQHGTEALRGLIGVEVVAGDMLSLHEGEDGEIYALGTETGDFLRMDDLEGTPYEEYYASQIARGAITNPGGTNARNTIPGICETEDVLSPTRVDGLFYFNNYEIPDGKSVHLTTIDEAVDNIVEGKRINKGTSGDLPDFGACMEKSRDPKKRAHVAGKKKLIESFSRVLKWHEIAVPGGKKSLCVGYQNGEEDYTLALERVNFMFRAEKIYFQKDHIYPKEDREKFDSKGGNGRWASTVVDHVEYDDADNVYYLVDRLGLKVLLTIDVFSPEIEKKKSYTDDGSGKKKKVVKTKEDDLWLEEELRKDGGQLYQRIVKTFYSNGFGPTSESNRPKINANMAKLKEAMRKKNLIAGVIYTQLGLLDMEHEGPRKAAMESMDLFSRAEFKSAGYQKLESDIRKLLAEKLARTMEGSPSTRGEIIQEITAYNLRRKERYNARRVRLKTSGISTPLYNGQAQPLPEFKVDLIPPKIREFLKGQIMNSTTQETMPAEMNESRKHYAELAKDSIDEVELTYRIMLHIGACSFSTTEGQLTVDAGRKRQVELSAKMAKELWAQKESSERRARKR